MWNAPHKKMPGWSRSAGECHKAKEKHPEASWREMRREACWTNRSKEGGTSVASTAGPRPWTRDMVSMVTPGWRVQVGSGGRDPKAGHG